VLLAFAAHLGDGGTSREISPFPPLSLVNYCCLEFFRSLHRTYTMPFGTLVQPRVFTPAKESLLHDPPRSRGNVFSFVRREIFPRSRSAGQSPCSFPATRLDQKIWRTVRPDPLFVPPPETLVMREYCAVFLSLREATPCLSIRTRSLLSAALISSERQPSLLIIAPPFHHRALHRPRVRLAAHCLQLRFQLLQPNPRSAGIDFLLCCARYGSGHGLCFLLAQSFSPPIFTCRMSSGPKFFFPGGTRESDVLF